MPSLRTYSTPGITRHLRREVEQLEACYQSALSKDEVFAVLKNIRDRIKAVNHEISNIEAAYLSFSPDDHSMFPDQELPPICTNRMDRKRSAGKEDFEETTTPLNS